MLPAAFSSSSPRIINVLNARGALNFSVADERKIAVAAVCVAANESDARLERG